MRLVDPLQVSSVLIKFLKESNKGLTRFQKYLKKAGPKPSGPGLESFFIAQSAFLISVREKVATKEEL